VFRITLSKQGMQKIVFVTFFFFSTSIVHAQKVMLDSLEKAFRTATDTQKVNILNELSKLSRNDSAIALRYAKKALDLSKKINYPKGAGMALLNSGFILSGKDTNSRRKAVAAFQAALPFLEQSGETRSLALSSEKIAHYYHDRGDYQQAIRYLDMAANSFQRLGDKVRSNNIATFKAHCYLDISDYPTAYRLGMETWRQAQETGDTLSIVGAMSHLSFLYLSAGLPEITVEYMHKILELYPSALKRKQNNDLPYDVIWGLAKGGEAYLKLNQIDSAARIAEIIPGNTDDLIMLLFFGHLYTAQHRYDEALSCFMKGFHLGKETGFEILTAQHANDLAQIYLSLHNLKQAFYYANYALTTAQKIHALLELRNAVGILNEIYAQRKDYEKVYYYSKWYKVLNDSVTPEQYRQKLSLIQVQNELESQRQHALLLNKENKIKEEQLSKETLLRKILIAGVVVLLLVAGMIVRNNRQKRKANHLLLQQKEEIERTLAELKSTQTQLIQQEKMASLGELTAGIAHEIQNPLNFVNNFSDVNQELLKELKDEAEKGNVDEVKAIANDVIANEQKILHHGKRADAIVKGMLQHSRASTGKKEPTDINALADEYLRLSYHGMRARDKSFNATLKTDFDNNIGKINIVPQDIGRVSLNLYNNAFYAVMEKQKNASTSSAGQAYEPTVSVCTRKVDGKAEIHVKDNGNGIPQKVLDKIFQPFFTTKPTGQGTGLGLSLSYDIIKAHGGEIKVETREGERSEFIIRLPV